MPYSTIVAGTTITSSWANASVRDQVVTPFADSTARDAAITVPVTGMVAYLASPHTLSVRGPSAWSTIGPVDGSGTNWSPTVTQGVAVSITGTLAKYWRVGRMIVANFIFGANSAGTGGSAITLGGLPASINVWSPLMIGGSGLVNDTSAVTTYPAWVVLASATTLTFMGTNGGSLGASGMTAALAAGDTISGTVIYEATTDA